jgi:hypothetical protein
VIGAVVADNTGATPSGANLLAAARRQAEAASISARSP